MVVVVVGDGANDNDYNVKERSRQTISTVPTALGPMLFLFLFYANRSNIRRTLLSVTATYIAKRWYRTLRFDDAIK